MSARTRVAAVAGSAAVMVVAAGVVAAGNPAAEPAAASVEPVASSRVVCPDPVGTPQINSTVSAFVVPGLPGQEGRGRAAIDAQGKGKPGETTTARIEAVGGSVSLTTAGHPLPPVVGTAAGALAPGFVVDQLTYADSGDDRGLAALACASPGTDAWFVGGGSRAGRTTVVVLANPENNAAQADVLLYSPSGQQAAPGGRGIVVPARRQVRLVLSSLAPGVEAFAIHVAVRSGRLAAAVSDQEVFGLEPKGADWVPTATPPARRVVVPGIPARVPGVTLWIAAPDRDASVKLRVFSNDGAFVPAGAESVDVPAGSLIKVQLAKVLDGSPAAVELVSDAPVVAGAVYETFTSDRQREYGYAAGARALTGPAAIAGMPGGEDADGRVVLTSVGAAARVGIKLVPVGGGQATSRTVVVPADATIVVPLTPPVAGKAFNVVVTPPAAGAAAVYAARLSVRRGASAIGATGYPLTTVRATVVVPAAGASLGAALPAG